ncbi:hypothetical protein [Naumannella halotolerans]|uniref:Uncharacterized protein n=1 Tax=Naumannella halotolerans TaxID=993414 RepID=A0A4R7J4N2_9ACTN|nr:hypothetical protein [Naumannella halotolerans]TDT31349.1 hypothetical protein CLV29_2768 [Naumannella halotolerans]
MRDDERPEADRIRDPRSKADRELRQVYVNGRGTSADRLRLKADRQQADFNAASTRLWVAIGIAIVVFGLLLKGCELLVG